MKKLTKKIKWLANAALAVVIFVVGILIVKHFYIEAKDTDTIQNIIETVKTIK